MRKNTYPSCRLDLSDVLKKKKNRPSRIRFNFDVHDGAVRLSYGDVKGMFCKKSRVIPRVKLDYYIHPSSSYLPTNFYLKFRVSLVHDNTRNFSDSLRNTNQIGCQTTTVQTSIVERFPFVPEPPGTKERPCFWFHAYTKEIIKIPQ